MLFEELEARSTAAVLRDDRADAARAPGGGASRRRRRARRAGRSRSAHSRPRHRRAHRAIVGGDGIYELEAASGDPRDDGRVAHARRRPRRRARPPARRLRRPRRDRGLARRRRSRSRPAASRGSRSRTRSSTHRRASSSARRSACTRPSRTLADAYTRVELSRSLALWAAWCVATGESAGVDRGRGRKSYAGESAVLRLRDRDPGARRHRLHLGAPAPPASTSALGIESFGAVGHAAARGDRRVAHRTRDASSASPAPIGRHPRRLRAWTA